MKADGSSITLFAKQQENISKLINGNFEILLKEIRKSQGEIKDLRKEISEFKVNLEFTENELYDKMKKRQEKHESINKAVGKSYISQVDSGLEGRSRRNNLGIYGISES